MSENRPVRILSFGAGVQSPYLARASLIGEVEPFDHVIFADTGDEPDAVYENMAWWRDRFRSEGVEFHVVKHGDPMNSLQDSDGISGDFYAKARGENNKALHPPFYMRDTDGTMRMMQRRCTSQYKIRPIEGMIRYIAKLANKKHMHITDHLVTQVLGISADESHRMKDHHYPWVRNEYPLVDSGITRQDCIYAMDADSEYPSPTRSACFHCPYRSSADWVDLRDNDPVGWDRAVEFDHFLRREQGVLFPGLTGTQLYIHRSGKPLDEVVFVDGSFEDDSGFGNECEGMCGL